jgi:methyl-accepting chemotaxis protein
MFNNLTLKGKILVLEATSFILFLAMAGFGVTQLSIMTYEIKEDTIRLNTGIEVMNNISSMEVHFLKEVKLAKDVWIRGADAEKIQKYRGEFVAQQEAFVNEQLAALAQVKNLTKTNTALVDFVNALNTLAEEHKLVTGKYLAQIIAHRNTADSDAMVAGIDRELSKQMTELREKFIKFVSE